MTCCGPGCPAKPHPREEDLRAGACLQHHVRRERPEAGRWLSGGGRRTGAGAERGGGDSRARGRRRQSAEAKLPVRDVLQDQEAIAAGQADKLHAAVGAHRQAGGILVVRDGVNDLGPQAPGQQAGEHIDVHAVAVHGNAAHVRLVPAERHDAAQVGGRLHDDHVAGVDVALGQQSHAVDATASDHQLARARPRSLQRLQAPGNVVADPGDALARRVLQGNRGIAGNEPPRDLRQDLGRERRRVREAAGERDDVGCPSQGEDGGDLAAA